MAADLSGKSDGARDLRAVVKEIQLRASQEIEIVDARYGAQCGFADQEFEYATGQAKATFDQTKVSATARRNESIAAATERRDFVLFDARRLESSDALELHRAALSRRDAGPDREQAKAEYHRQMAALRDQLTKDGDYGTYGAGVDAAQARLLQHQNGSRFVRSAHVAWEKVKATDDETYSKIERLADDQYARECAVARQEFDEAMTSASGKLETTVEQAGVRLRRRREEARISRDGEARAIEERRDADIRAARRAG
jgi:paraquat-inducible protein B